MKIKICGIRRLEDVKLMNKYKPDYIGFIFAESKRKISKELAKELRNKMDKNIQTVGIFVNQSLEEIVKIADYSSLDIIQLHGDENIEYIKSLRKELGKNIKIWKAFSVKSEAEKEVEELEIKFKIYEKVIDLYLLDAYNKEARGGTGESFNWDIARSLSLKYKIALAGGITPTNVSEAAKIVKPLVIDLSSGVETDGFKDEKKIKILMKNFKN